MDIQNKLKNRNNFPDIPEDELILRGVLFFHHGCSSEYLYSDDGELQCSNPKHGKGSPHPWDFYIDFRRDSPELIAWKLMSEEGKKIAPRPER